MSESSFPHLSASRRQWWLVVITGALTLICGTIGLWKYDHAHATGPVDPVSCALASLYHALQMLILHTPHFDQGSNLWIEAGCWCGAFTLLTTTGMLLWKRLSHEIRLVRLANWSGHYVVCGLGQKGMKLVRFLKEENPRARIVVIDRQPDEHFADDCAALGVCVLMNDATRREVLDQARAAQAGEVIVITPEDETNVRIATEVRKLCAASPSGRVACSVHLSNIHLRERLQMLDTKGPGMAAGCVLSFFDVFDCEARRVLASLPLDGAGISRDDPRSVHVVILGFGRMGRSIALRAAKMGHFANRKPLRISVICRDAEHQHEQFLFRYPALQKKRSSPPPFCDLTFHNANAESFHARELIVAWAAEPDTLLHLFICVDANSRAVEIGLRIQEALVGRPDCSLLVRINAQASMAEVLDSNPEVRPHIRIFGTVEDACCERAWRHEYHEGFAREIHKGFVRRRLSDSIRKPESDPALNDWDQLREDFRESNRQQADHAAIKLRAIGCELVAAADPRDALQEFTAREVELLAEMEHARWNAERLLAGWRYGTPSRKDQRINENLCAWDELDDSIKKYDREAVSSLPEVVRLSPPPMKVVRKKPV